MSEISYNGASILTGQPAPFAAREDSFIRYGDRWADKTTITLRGQITGCGSGELVAAQNTLISIFSTDFKTLVVGGFSSDYVMVRRVSFPSGAYNYGLTYEVVLDCYPDDLFVGTFGVLDPVDEWSFEEQDNRIVRLIHTVSARGLVTTQAGFRNAKSFVTPRLGLDNMVDPIFVNIDEPTLVFCLKSQHESINRFNGTYSVQETYVADAYYGASGLFRYTTNFDCNTLDGLAKVTVEGSIDGCGRASSMATIRGFYNALDFYGIANDAFTAAGGGGTLNTTYTSNQVVEDLFNKKITFSRTYDNNPDDVVFLDYSVTLSTSENDVTTASFEGVIKGRGDLTARWIAVQAYYDTLNPYTYAAAAYATLGLPYPLNTVPNKNIVSFNQFNAEISVSEEWDNKDAPPAGLKSLNFTMHFTPAFQKIAYNPLANVCDLDPVDSWYVVDLGFKTRCSFSVNGNARVCAPATIPDAIVEIRQIGNALFSVYCPSTSARLEKKDIGNTTDSVNFDFGWSAVSPFLIDPPPNYSTINNLALK